MLPKYFVVPYCNSYKLYLNTVFKSEATLNTSICVLWPYANAEAHVLTTRLRDEISESSFTRKWNGEVCDIIRWTYTGSEMNLYLSDREMYITAPVISVPSELYNMLPFNSHVFNPTREAFIAEVDTSNYTKARVYYTDPASEENTAPITVRSDPIPVAPVLLTSSSTGQIPFANPASSMPPHIVRLVIADAISKKECCPISCDDITMENATVTSCGHVFTKVAIQTWLSNPSSKGLCPVCKQRCS
jgi:hypothetical protein